MTSEKVLNHYNTYPKMQLQDLYKFLYQSAFGCEHMTSSILNVEEHLIRELNEIKTFSDVLTEELDGDYFRVHLSYLEKGLSAKTLARLFSLSAQREENGKEKLKEKLSVVRELVLNHKLPFDLEEFDLQLKKWEEEDFSSVHHTDTFCKEYAPAYRLVAGKFIPFLPLFAEIDKITEKNPFPIIAIEGKSASGKTTLSRMIEEIYDCNVFHMDDFFLRSEQRTPERYNEPGGNIDYERFSKEVLNPLKNGENVNYRRLNCATMEIEEGILFTEKKLAIIEGAYSMHPELSQYYDMSVFLEITQEIQKKRIEKRNSPDMADRFFNEWIPLENEYFSKLDIKEKCDLIIKTAV